MSATVLNTKKEFYKKCDKGVESKDFKKTVNIPLATGKVPEHVLEENSNDNLYGTSDYFMLTERWIFEG